MKLWVLGSGSKGNAVLLESAGTRVLVDAGFPAQVMLDRLAAIQIAPESIQGLLVTHEHKDHMRGVRVLASRFPSWEIHASAGTVVLSRDVRESGAKAFRAGTVISIGDLDLSTTKAPHDAAEHIVTVATSRHSGARAGIAYDLGCITEPVVDTLRDLDLLVLEANHDEDMLRNGPYPESVQKRIAGRRGHLSNRLAGMLARKISHRGLRHVILAHLSEVCNTPEHAVNAIRDGVAPSRFQAMITHASQDAIAGPFEPVYKPARQLELGLL